MRPRTAPPSGSVTRLGAVLCALLAVPGWSATALAGPPTLPPPPPGPGSAVPDEPEGPVEPPPVPPGVTDEEAAPEPDRPEAPGDSPDSTSQPEPRPADEPEVQRPSPRVAPAQPEAVPPTAESSAVETVDAGKASASSGSAVASVPVRKGTPGDGDAASSSASPPVPPPQEVDEDEIASGWGPTVVEEAPPDRGRFEHKGFVLDAGVGMLGCTGGMCGRGRHDASPGVRVEGFLGGNLMGFLELGLLGGWGRMQTSGAQGSVLDLYGIDAGSAEPLADELGIDLGGLDVQDATIEAANVAPVLRLHFPRKGRVGAFVGGGVGYSLLRTRYEGTTDDFRIDFHGIDVPIHGGLLVYVVPRLAVGAQFEYRWSRFLAIAIDHPERTAGAPLGALSTAAENQGLRFDPQLPHTWTTTFGLRLTL